MYERRRRATDLEGHIVELVERQESVSAETKGCEMTYRAPAKLFGPDGKQLIPEGHGFYRTAFGVRFKLID